MTEVNILEVKDLTVAYNVSVKKENSIFSHKAKLNAVNNVSFSLKKGEILGIVGESGCGKSTLGKAILNLLQAEVNGRVIYMGNDIANINDKKMKPFRKDMQIIFQDPLASLDPKMLVKDIIAEPLKVYYPKLKKSEVQQKVYEMMDKVGLNRSVANRYPHEFSGGQCQRIGIARAMILQPKILICDEAVSALDVSIKAQILNLLQDLQKEFDMSVIFISHDLSVVKYISDRILVFYLGTLVEKGNSESIYHQPAHPYTKALLSAAPDPFNHLKQRIILSGDLPSPLDVPKGCPFVSRCPYAQEVCKQKKPSLETIYKDQEHLVACYFPLVN